MQAINQSQVELIKELNRVRADLATHNRVDNFYDSLAEGFHIYGSLTERQEAALRRSLAQYNERNARIVANRKERVITSPIPTGRVTIIGKVISTKWVENDFGGSLKMLVESEQGWRVFGTVPSRLTDKGELVKGTKVAFTAAVTPKEADFGFFSRPTGGAVLKDEPAAVVAAPSADGLPDALLSVGEMLDRVERMPAPKAPIAPDLKPEDLLQDYNSDLGRAARWQAHCEAPAPKLTGLADMVAAAGY